MTATVSTTYSPKLPSEQIFLTVDFAAILRPLNATIVSTVVTASVRSGVDPSPADIFGGASSTFLGTIVSQRVTGGIAGVSYLLNFQVTSSDTSVTSVQVLLPVVAQRLG